MVCYPQIAHRHNITLNKCYIYCSDKWYNIRLGTFNRKCNVRPFWMTDTVRGCVIKISHGAWQKQSGHICDEIDVWHISYHKTCWELVTCQPMPHPASKEIWGGIKNCTSLIFLSGFQISNLKHLRRSVLNQTYLKFWIVAYLVTLAPHITNCYINPLWPSDSICPHWSLSTILVKIMACHMFGAKPLYELYWTTCHELLYWTFGNKLWWN